MDLGQVAIIMSQGHRHTLKLLTMCIDVNPYLLVHLNDMNMRGPQIWTAYYYFAEGIYEKFESCVLGRDTEMVNYVNKACPGPRAVREGGAPK